MPRQGHRGRDGDDRARLRARTAAALARGRLAVRAAGRACVSPSRPGVLALALRLALEWLYLYDGGSVDQRGLSFSMCCEVGRRCKSAGFSTGFPQFAQCFVRAHTAVSSLCGSIYQINFLKRPGHLFKGGGVQGGTLAGGSLFIFCVVRVRRYAGWFSLACPAIRPHFFGACPKKRCRAAKEKRFEASTSPWWARPPLPFGRKPQRDKLVRQVDLYTLG